MVLRRWGPWNDDDNGQPATASCWHSLQCQWRIIMSPYVYLWVLMDQSRVPTQDSGWSYVKIVRLAKTHDIQYINCVIAKFRRFCVKRSVRVLCGVRCVMVLWCCGVCLKLFVLKDLVGWCETDIGRRGSTYLRTRFHERTIMNHYTK